MVTTLFQGHSRTLTVCIMFVLCMFISFYTDLNIKQKMQYCLK